MANEVGRVHVRVLPDTTGFAMRTKAKLKALKEQTYTVKVDIDEKKFRAQLDRMIAQTNVFLGRQKNHIRFRADLRINKKDARAQAAEMRSTYQGMADSTPDVRFSSALEREALSASVQVTPSIDQTAFVRDLSRAVKRATKGGNVSIWGDRRSVERQADRASAIFRDRMEYVNRDTSMFGDAAAIEEQALRAARSTKERLREALSDFNIFGAPKDIEDQTSDAVDVFKRKWKEAQGELNIRADLEWDRVEFQRYIDQVEDLTVAHSKGVDKLNAHKRGLTGMLAQMRQARVRMGRLRSEMDKMDSSSEDYAERWEDANTKIRESGRTVERLKDSVDEMTAKLQTLALDIELDSADLVDAEAEVDRFRQRIEMQAIELETDIKTAASEAALAFLARPRVIELRTRITGRAKQAIGQLGEISRFNWSSIGNAMASFGTRSTGIRMLYQTARDIIDIVPKLDMMIPALAKTTALATAGIAAAGTLLASAVSIGADMMKAGQALLIAPAGLAGLGVAALVYVSAFQQMNEIVPEINDSFTRLTDTLGADFWKADGGRVSGFLVSLFDALRAYSPRITKEFADVTAAMAEGMAASGEVQGPRFMENLLRGLKGAEGGFRSLGSALTVLMGAGSDSFESLGRWFTGVMGDFDAWAKRNDANGNITRWIDEGAQAIRDIGSLIYSTGSIFATFGEIVKEAGGPSLSDFARGMRQLREAVKGPGFRGEAIPTLESMFSFMGQLGTLKPQILEATATALEGIRYGLDNLAGPITDIFGATLDGFNDPIFTRGFEQFVDGMGSFLEDIAPGWERFVAELGGLFGVVGEGAMSFGPAFNELLLLVSNIGANVHPGLEDFLRFVGPELEKFVTTIAPGLEDMATGISDILSNKGFQGFLSDVADKLGTIAEYALDAGNAILDFVEAAFDEYDAAPEWLQDLSTWLLAIGGASIFAAPLIKPLLAPLGALIGLFKVPLGNMAKNGILGAVDRLSKINWSSLWKGIGTGVAGGAKGVLPRLLGVFSGPVGWLTLIASAIKPLTLSRIGDAVLEALGLDDSWAGKLWRYVGDRFEEIFGDVSLLRVFSPIFNGVSKAIEQAIEGWDNGGIFGAVEGFFSGLGDGLSDSFQMAWSLLSGALTDGLAFIRDSFQSWEPKGDFGKAFKYVIESIPGLLGLDGAQNWSWSTLTSTWGEFGRTAWREIKAWLDEQIQGILDDFEAWEPTTAVGRGFKNMVKLIGGLLGFDESGNWSWDSLTSNWKSFASDAWKSIKSWLDEQVDKIWDKISSWTPVMKALDLLESVGDAIAEALGFDDWDDLTGDIEDWWEDLRDEVEACLENAWDDFKGWLADWTPTAVTLIGGPAAMVGRWVADLLGLDEGWAWDCDDLVDFWDTAWGGFKKWAQDKWEELVGKIGEWTPISVSFSVTSWIAGLVADFLNGAGGATEEPDLDPWWPKVKRWFQDKWEELIEDLGLWTPQTISFNVTSWIIEKVVDLFSSSGGGASEPDDSGPSWFDSAKAWLRRKWEDLVEDIRNWSPPSLAFKFGAWLGRKLRDLFSGGGNAPTDGGASWFDSARAWLQRKWDELVEDIRNWSPVSTGIKLGTWLWDKIRELFSKDEEPDDSDPIIDWEKWENKIKNAIRTGLVGLIAAITSPLWIPLAPIFIGAKIVEWIFGAEGEGPSPQEIIDTVKDRVQAWWGPIREGLSSGIENIGRLVGEIVHDVICLPQYIMDEIFTDCFDEEGMESKVRDRTLGWGNPVIMGLKSGISTIRENIQGAMDGEGAGPSTPGNGMLDRLLGTTPAHVTGTIGNLGRLLGGVGAWGAGVVGRFGEMGSGTRREIAGLTDNTEAEFGTMSSTTQGDAQSMGSGVVGQFASMKARAAVQAAALQASVVASMARANAQSVAQGATMSRLYVAQMVGMSARAVATAAIMAANLASTTRFDASGSGRYVGDTFSSGLGRALSGAVSLAYGFRSSIRSALSFSAYSSGSAIGSSFASGIRSRASSVRSAAYRLARAARASLPNSPAEEGPFSGSGWGGWGESIGDELARGLRLAAPVVAQEAEALMSGVQGALDARAGIGVGVSGKAAGAARVASKNAAQAAAPEASHVSLSPEDRTLLAEIRDASNITLDGRSLSKGLDRSRVLRGAI